ncbi:glutaredoxin family protein [Halobacillus sp. A1]|uniref:glutaredoxin family protein n=1 Tax=Halobacillus sp. A1 TaxID=2880262 RepID=UPI0020A6B132|nr:glutaredoxin family protein [Halobacillus sp. A1]MCP3033457.1 glutaredoxin family protein [Halobacillus sp. A1]
MEIIVFTQSGCVFCDKQKKWMDAHKINYFEKDILQSEENYKEFLNHKPLGVPYTIIDKDGVFQKFSGFTSKLKKKLQDQNLS